MAVTYGNDRGATALGLEDKAYVDAELLKNVANQTVFDRFATIRKELPQKVGNTITFERKIPMFELMYYEQLNKKYALGWDLALGMDLSIIMPKDEYTNYILEEGSSGSEKGQMKSIETEASVIPIGMWRGYTEELATFAKRWNLQREAQEQSEVASQVIDGFYRDTYTKGATNRQDITGNDNGENRVQSSSFSKAVSRAVLAMELQGAKPVVHILKSSPNYATKPVKASFKMIVPSTAVEELKANPDFISVEESGSNYQEQDFTMRLEGYIKGVEVYSTPRAYAKESGDLLEGEFLIFGKDHTAQIPLRGKNRIEMIVKGLGQSGEDRLNRVGSVGWKAWIGAKVLYPERLAVIKANYDL